MSNLFKHAEHELSLIHGERSGDIMDDYATGVEAAVLEIIKAFSEQGHSGMSAGIVTSMVEKLCALGPLHLSGQGPVSSRASLCL